MKKIYLLISEHALEGQGCLEYFSKNKRAGRWHFSPLPKLDSQTIVGTGPNILQPTLLTLCTLCPCSPADPPHPNHPISRSPFKVTQAPGRGEDNHTHLFDCGLSSGRGQTSGLTAHPTHQQKCLMIKQGENPEGPTDGLGAGIWYDYRPYPTTSPRLTSYQLREQTLPSMLTTCKVGHCNQLNRRQMLLSHNRRAHATHIGDSPEVPGSGEQGTVS